MPIVSGTLSAAGSSSLSGVGASTVSGALTASGGSSSGWVRFLDGSTLAAAGSSAVAAVGSALRTLIALGSFTYDPLVAPTFASTIRRNPALTISTQLGSTPTVGKFKVGDEPQVGEDVQLDLGSGLLFGGTLQVKTLTYDGKPSLTPTKGPKALSWDCTVGDYSWLANARYPVGCFANKSASIVATTLIADWVPGFTSIGVQAGLPSITIEFDGTKSLADCLTAIDNLIGSYHRFVGKDLHLYITEASTAPQELNNTTNTTLQFDPAIEYSEDIRQIRNLIDVFGASATLTADAAPGATTIQVDDLSIFSGGGGTLASGCQRLGYNGANINTNTPSRGSGGGNFSAVIERGSLGTPVSGKIRILRSYRVSFILPDGTESDLGQPVQSDGTGQVTYPGSLLSAVATVSAGGGVPSSGPVVYQVSARTADGAVYNGGSSGISVTILPTQNAVTITLSTFIFDGRVIALDIWRTKAVPTGSGPGGVPLFYLTGSVSIGTPSFTDTNTDASLVQLAPVDIDGLQFDGLNTTGGQVKLSNLPISGAQSFPSTQLTGLLTPISGTVDSSTGLSAGTIVNIQLLNGPFAGSYSRQLSPSTSGTSLVWTVALPDTPSIHDTVTAIAPTTSSARKIYAANVSSNGQIVGQYELLTTINDNLTSEFIDNTSTTDDQELFLQNAIVMGGSSAPVNGSTGVGTAGPGSTYIQTAANGATTTYRNVGTITNPIWQNITSNLPPGALPSTHTITINGVTGITHTIYKGDKVRLWTQVADLAAQSYLAGKLGGNGIRQFPVVDDSLTSNAALVVRGNAELTLWSMPIKELRYTTLDPLSVVGALIPINLTNPPVSIPAGLRIQTVVITNTNDTTGALVKYAVVASSVKFTLQDLLRKAVLGA